MRATALRQRETVPVRASEESRVDARMHARAEDSRGAFLPFLFLSLLFIYNSNLHLIFSGDSGGMRLLPFSILLHGNLYLDSYLSSPTLGLAGAEDNNPHSHSTAYRRGHWMSAYPVVVPIAISPLYIPAAWYVQHQHIAQDGIVFERIVEAMEKLSSSVIASISAVFVYLCLLRLSGSRRIAIGLTLVYALASNTWVIGSQALWQHGMSELLIGLTVWLLLAAEENEAALFGAGIAAAMSVANRPPNIVFAAVASIYVLRQVGISSWRFFIAAAPVAILYLAYNYYYFGTATGVLTVISPSPTLLSVGLAGLMVSPSHGLLIYTPWAIFAGIGAFVSFTSPKEAPIFRYLALVVLGEVLLYAKWGYWWGGWCFGPRFLTDMMPLLTMLLIPALRIVNRRAALQWAFVAAVCISFSVQVIGAYLRFNQDIKPAQLWSWSHSQIVDAVRNHSLAFWSPGHSELLPATSKSEERSPP